MRILIVDDEKIISGALGRVLTRSGHEITIANNGIEAIQILADTQAPFDYCFIDLLMPEISGATVLDAVKQKCPTATVFMMTAYGDPGVREDLMGRGAAKVIAKPFDDINSIPSMIK